MDQPRYDRLELMILSADGSPSGLKMPLGLEEIAERAAESWTATWRGVRFKLQTRRTPENVVVAWLRFATPEDQAAYAELWPR